MLAVSVVVLIAAFGVVAAVLEAFIIPTVVLLVV